MVSSDRIDTGTKKTGHTNTGQQGLASTMTRSLAGAWVVSPRRGPVVIPATPKKNVYQSRQGTIRPGPRRYLTQRAIRITRPVLIASISNEK